MRSGSEAQLPLFGGRLDSLPLFKAALADAMKKCKQSRAEIADAMNKRLQDEGLKGDVTEAKLNKWASPSDRTHKPSLDQLPFLLAALGDYSPLDALIRPLEVRLAGNREQRLIDLAEGRLQAKKAAKRIKAAEAALEEMR